MVMESNKQNPVPAAESQLPQEDEFTYLIENLNRIIRPLVELLELKAFEVYFTNPTADTLERVFHTGELSAIWQSGALSGENGYLIKHYERTEARTINLPNRRIAELNIDLKEKAFGQVYCLPLLLNNVAIGMICAAHTRRRMLTDKEKNLLSAVNRWIAGVFRYERRNRQIRAEIVTEERERIGMDLHDGIIQSLYGIGLAMDNARINLEKGKGDAVELISKSLEAIQAAIADIRAYILDLRPRQLQHPNMFDGMRSLAREFRANTLVKMDLDGKAEDVDGLAQAQVDALFHIYQEAISNTAKHARATSVSVRLWRTRDRVMLRISDDGQGFEVLASTDSKKRIGHGLANMRARAEGAGGGMEVVSIRRQGTILTAWVPFIPEGKQ